MKKISITEILAMAESCGVNYEYVNKDQVDHKIIRGNGKIESFDSSNFMEFFYEKNIVQYDTQTSHFTFSSQLMVKNISKNSKSKFDSFEWKSNVELTQNSYSTHNTTEQKASSIVKDLLLAS